MLKITHLAHAGFLIENEGERLIIDPADDSFGYEIKNEVVNYLLVSHPHWDHNNVVNITIQDNHGSFIINKIDSYHDHKNGNLRGHNIIHIIETEDVRICHLGDLGHILTTKQVELIGKVDILLIPVGGVFTIDYKEAIQIIKQLNPQVIIPMHYQTDLWGSDKGIDSVDKFIQNINDYQIIKLATYHLDYEPVTKKTIYITI